MATTARRPGQAQQITASAGPAQPLTDEEKRRRRLQLQGGGAPGQQAPWSTPSSTASTSGSPSRNPFSSSVYSRPAQTMQGPTLASFSARPQMPVADNSDPWNQMRRVAGSTPNAPGGSVGGMFMPSGVPGGQGQGGGQDQNPWQRFMQTLSLGAPPPAPSPAGGGIPLGGIPLGGGPGPGGSGPGGMQLGPINIPKPPGLGPIPMPQQGGSRPPMPGPPQGGVGNLLGQLIGSINPQAPRPPQQNQQPQQPPLQPPRTPEQWVPGGIQQAPQQPPMPPVQAMLPQAPPVQAPVVPPSFALPGGGTDWQAQANWYAAHQGQAAPGGGTYNNTAAPSGPPSGYGGGPPSGYYYGR